jgi:hypothetical protein
VTIRQHEEIDYRVPIAEYGRLSFVSARRISTCRSFSSA